MAIAAFAAQDQPAYDGNIIVGLDRAAATRATRTRRNDRLTRRDARDADVQKAADDESEEQKCGD